MHHDEDERVVDGRMTTIILPTSSRSAKRIDGEKDVLIVEGDRGGVQVQSFAFPLDFYLRKEFISRAQWRAGNKLHRLWSVSGLEGYVQFQYRESRGTEKKLEFTPPGAFAFEYRDAMKAIEKYAARRVAYHVCCEGKTLAKDKCFNNPKAAQRAGMPLLLEALDQLVKHFGY